MVKTATQLSITMPHIPGSLARISDALRGAGININAIASSSDATGEVVRIYLILDEPAAGKLALEHLGPVTQKEVLAFSRSNKQGAIFEIARTCAGANVNIGNIYATTHGSGTSSMVYVEVDDLEKAKELFAE